MSAVRRLVALPLYCEGNFMPRTLKRFASPGAGAWTVSGNTGRSPGDKRLRGGGKARVEEFTGTNTIDTVSIRPVRLIKHSTQRATPTLLANDPDLASRHEGNRRDERLGSRPRYDHNCSRNGRADNTRARRDTSIRPVATSHFLHPPRRTGRLLIRIKARSWDRSRATAAMALLFAPPAVGCWLLAAGCTMSLAVPY